MEPNKCQKGVPLGLMLGAFLMRSAGCIINDLIDIDRDVISDAYFNSFEKIMEN